MKKTVWRDGDHMVFESGHQTFDRQVDCISTGNVIGSVQSSSYIRPYTETSCGPNDRQPGFLRDYDLEWWVDLGTPSAVLEFVVGVTESTPVILYEFHHYRGKKRVTHGFVVTSTDHRLLETFVTGPTYKSEWIIREAIEYICIAEGKE